MSNTTPEMPTVEYQWLVQPSTDVIIPANRWPCLIWPNVIFQFTLHGPWISEGQDESLLFVITAIPQAGPSQSPFAAVALLPSPYRDIHANGFASIRRTDIHPGQNSLSFNNTMIFVSGTYRLKISALIVTPQQRVGKWLPGSITSNRFRVEGTEANRMHTHWLLPPHCSYCEEYLNSLLHPGYQASTSELTGWHNMHMAS